MFLILCTSCLWRLESWTLPLLKERMHEIKKKRLQVVVFLKLDSSFINTITEHLHLMSELLPSSYGNSQSIKTEARTISYGRVREVRATSDWQLAHGTLLNHPEAPLC